MKYYTAKEHSKFPLGLLRKSYEGRDMSANNHGKSEKHF